MSTVQRREVVVITGASAGVGRATAHAFARAGARIGLIARGTEGLDATAREVEELGGESLVLPADVADPDAVEDAARQVEERFGAIDVWVNNAMTTVFSPLMKITPGEFHRVTEVTYLGFVYGTMAALRRMAPRNRGTIVQVGSALAYRGIPLQSAYCGAKHAIQGFTESVRTELYHEHSNVWITMVQMPALNTPQFEWGRSHMPARPQPVPPIYQPEVAADAVYYAAHHRRREMLVGRSTVMSVLANYVAPGLLDRYLGRSGYQSQLTSQPEDPDRPDNLFEAVPGDFGAHGPFDARAEDTSIQLWMDTHRRPLVLGVLGTAGAAGALVAMVVAGASRMGRSDR